VARRVPKPIKFEESGFVIKLKLASAALWDLSDNSDDAGVGRRRVDVIESVQVDHGTLRGFLFESIAL